ncbi:hypothetical protein GF386_01920, partial [Candidatus Pacearchaeota archaeon]|nr:hypothetical protein [Candidatus Pacearchaeota archaeon]
MILIIVTFATNFYGNVDIADYSNVAKFFAGEYKAKIRSSHSYLYGFIQSPFVFLFKSYIFFKISNLIILALIIYSVYKITNNKKALWLMLLSPIVWYMAPFISPIQLASLFLLWSWFFIKKYDSNQRLKYLFISGILLGLSWAVYD